MAREIRNDCCDCAAPGYPCLGSHCPRRNVEYLVCDKCRNDADCLYEYEGKELCEECLLEQFTKIE